MNLRPLIRWTCPVMLLVLRAGVSEADYTTPPDQAVENREPWPDEIAIPRRDTVTREKYLDTAKVFFDGIQRNTDYWLAQPKPYPNMSVYVDSASWLSRMYELTGKETYAQTAVRCLDHAHRLIAEPQTDQRNTQPSWLTVVDLYFVQKRLDRNPVYSAQHRQWIREIALRALPSFPAQTVEYGAFNRAAHAALAGEALLLLVPDAPDAAQWRVFKEEIWNDWWRFRDTDESTDHYNALWFRYLLQWIQLRGCEQEFWADAGVRRLFERYLYQVFPMGAFPHYSDSCGWNVTWGHWVYLFESCATHFRDGRYKWAAHRLYDYGVSRIENLNSWSYTGSEAGWSLLQAYAVADDTVPEKPRELAAAALTRHKAMQRSEPERIASRRFFDLAPETAPDKLVFFGGSDRDALSLMVDAVGDAGHSHARRPAILALADHQSVLLMSLGYLERLPEDHHLPLLTDYEGFPYDNTPYHIQSANNQVREATVIDLGAAAYGRVRIERYQGYDATLLREIVFVKQAGVLVKDTLTLGADLKVRWSPLYRVRNVGPDYGDHWINSYTGPWVPLRGLGRNAPVYTRWRNSPRDLLIYFLPEAQGKLELVNEKERDATLPLPWRVQYTLRQEFQAGQPVAATTLLVPHAPGKAGPLAEGVQVQRDAVDCLVVEFPDASGMRNLVVLNATGQAISLDGLVTDAHVACLRHRDGQCREVAKHGGQRLEFSGVDVSQRTK